MSGRPPQDWAANNLSVRSTITTNRLSAVTLDALETVKLPVGFTAGPTATVVSNSSVFSLGTVDLTLSVQLPQIAKGDAAVL